METIKKFIQDHPVPVIGVTLFGIIGTGVTIYSWLFPPSQRPVYYDIFFSDWNLNSKKGNLTSKEEIKEIDGINFIIERQRYTK